MNDLNLITTYQLSFRKCYSNATALVKIYDDFLNWLDTGNFIWAVSIDLQKAFNTVEHYIFLKKCVPCGAEGRELEYVSNHIQQVNYKGPLSDELPVTMGVQQGSILGSLLFIIFMNDASDAIKLMLDSYADVHPRGF